MRLRPATPADFAFIRSLAQRPDYTPFISDEDEAALAAYAADPSVRLLVAEDAVGSTGFALFCEVGDPSGRVELRRLALGQAGQGKGAAFIAALVDYAFLDLGAQKLWLDASGENLRAQKVYTRAGFTEEGRLRAHWHRPALGRNVDLVIYGMLRSEWTLAAPAPRA